MLLNRQTTQTMSNWTPKEGSGTLFENDRKEQDNHPDWKGDILIDGVSYWLSGWRKGGSNGRSAFISLSAKRKDPNKTVDKALKQVREQSDQSSAPSAASSGELPFEDDDIPF
jgi:hypothetical protein